LGVALVYIIYSKLKNKYYVGSCNDLKERLNQHYSKKFEKSYIKQADDWELFFQIDNLEYQQARKIERHVKAMKSRKYILNLLKYPEMIEKLKDRYKLSWAGSFR
jgi:putative endonuclease